MRHWLVAVTIAPVLAFTQGAQKPKPVTLDFAITRANDIQASRWMMWTKDHHLLLADETSNAGGLIDLDAATRKRTHIGSPATLESLVNAGGPKLEKLFAPDAVDQSGHYLGYGFNQGFFLLEISTNSFKKTNIPIGAEEIHFSSDGKWLSFVHNHDLYILSTNDDEAKRITSNGKPNLLNGTMTWVYWEEIYGHDPNAAWWSPDNTKIAYLETDESPVPLTTYVNYSPQYATTATQCYPKTGNANPIVRLKVADINTGQIQTVPVVKNQEYIVGVKWADPKQLLFQTYNRAQTEARYNIYNVASEEVKTPEIDREKWLNGSFDFDLIEGGSSLLFVSPRSGFDHLCKVPVSGGKVSPITKGDWQLESNVEGPTAVEHIDKKTGRIIFTGTKDSFLQRQVYSVNADGTDLKRITHGRGYHYVLVSNDGQYFTDEYSNIDSPPVTRLWTADGRALEIVDAVHPELQDAIYHNNEKFVFFPARDGYQLAAKLRMPRKLVAGKKYPVIMHIYGGPEMPMVMDRFSFFWAIDQLLSDNGYIVISVDCRTAMIRGKQWVNKYRGHLYSAVERNDFVDAARWIKKQPYADGNRLGIWGWSGGGANTINCLCHTTEFKAGVAGAPCVDLSFYDTFYSEHLFGLPKDNPQGYRDAAVWRFAKDMHGKLLLAWGSGDDNVQQQSELNFINACIDAGKQIQIVIAPNRGHGFGDTAAQKYFYQAMLDFFKANL